mmetsp:Transcript_41241/g.131947  ORF Transcript_41241/g.131947 Transcript_41241/m.131947 type:complete len:207 (-) Transcript_41241:39-659(-)
MTKRSLSAALRSSPASLTLSRSAASACTSSACLPRMPCTALRSSSSSALSLDASAPESSLSFCSVSRSLPSFAALSSPTRLTLSISNRDSSLSLTRPSWEALRVESSTLCCWVLVAISSSWRCITASHSATRPSSVDIVASKAFLPSPIARRSGAMRGSDDDVRSPRPAICAAEPAVVCPAMASGRAADSPANTRTGPRSRGSRAF